MNTAEVMARLEEYRDNLVNVHVNGEVFLGVPVDAGFFVAKTKNLKGFIETVLLDGLVEVTGEDIKTIAITIESKIKYDKYLADLSRAAGLVARYK